MKTKPCKGKDCLNVLESKTDQKMRYCSTCRMTLHPLILIMKKHGVTQIGLAKLLGISQSNVSKITSDILQVDFACLGLIRHWFNVDMNLFVFYRHANDRAILNSHIMKSSKFLKIGGKDE